MDVVIIGAGASGLLCAIEAGKRKRSVLVLEHSKRIGNKIRISGGGHCNFTNLYADHENYLSNNPDFCRSALTRFTPNDFIRMVKRHGIKYIRKDDGRVFCKGSSLGIIQMLQKECDRVGVNIRLNCLISEIKSEIKSDTRENSRFTVLTNYGTIESKSLVVATGGLSCPESGASDIGYRIARQFNLNVTTLKPALVPLTFTPEDQKIFHELSGVSFHAMVSSHGRKFQGDVLVTHRGLSGPAILQISSYWNIGDDITINLLPGQDVYGLLLAKRGSRMEIKNLLSGYLPKRLAQKWCDLYIQSRPVNQYSDRELEEIAHRLQHWTIRPAGTMGYRKAEVTLGGVDTDELSSKTMGAKKVPGLYFVGEVVDVTGQLGGYNLHWARASGYAARQYV